MNGFFSQLTQRTLGTAQTVRPTLIPRFAQSQPLVETNELSTDDSIDSIENLEQKSSTLINSKNNQKLQAPVTELVQTKRMDSSHIQENPRQTKTRLISSTESNPDLHTIPSERKQGDVNLVKLEPVKTENRLDLVKPNVELKQDTETENIEIATKTQIVTKNRVGRIIQETDLTPDRKMDKKPVVDKLLVSMPYQQIQNPENSSYATDLNPLVGLNDHDSLNQSVQQDSNDPQTINVTIGRIDVRAVNPPPPIKREIRKPKPTLSLDDYLQQRQKGER